MERTFSEKYYQNKSVNFRQKNNVYLIITNCDVYNVNERAANKSETQFYLNLKFISDQHCKIENDLIMKQYN